MEIGIFALMRFQPADEHFVGAQPLAEDNDLDAGHLKKVFQKRHAFVHFVTAVRLMVDQVGAVAGHAHQLESNHKFALVRLGQKTKATPFRHNLGHHLAVVFMDIPLFLRHIHKKMLVRPFGQFTQHLVLVPAQQHRCQAFLDAV